MKEAKYCFIKLNGNCFFLKFVFRLILFSAICSRVFSRIRSFAHENSPLYRRLISINCEIIESTRYNGWSYNKTAFFITGGHERQILGIDNIPHDGLKLAQKLFPNFRITPKSQSIVNSIGLVKKKETILKTFPRFNRIGKIKM